MLERMLESLEVKKEHLGKVISLMGEVNSAAKDQSRGIDQINRAITKYGRGGAEDRCRSRVQRFPLRDGNQRNMPD